MKLRAVEINKKFIPEFNDNKKLPVNEQLVIHFGRIPGTSEKMTYKTFKFDSSGTMQLSYNDNLMLATFVSKVENLELDNGNKIKDGKDLATASHPALEKLFTEIRDYLFPDEGEFEEGESEA